MAADFFLGESLVGEGNEIAHIDLVIGSKSGHAGAAFVNALANNKDGFTTLLAVVTPNLPANIGGEQYMYFTERDIDRILENLDGLRERVFPKLHGDEALDARHAQHFPSVCLIGLGRCGSNIALDVASLVYNARRFYLNEFSNQEKSGGEQRPAGWLRSNLRLAGSRAAEAPLWDFRLARGV